MPAAPAFAEEELTAFDAGNAGHVRGFVAKLSGAAVGVGEVEAAWSRMALPYLLMNWLRQPHGEEAIIDQLAELPERRGVDREALRREIEAALMVGPCIDSSNPVRLRPRVHRFLRGLAHFWRCTNPVCGKLVGEGVDECDDCRAHAASGSVPNMWAGTSSWPRRARTSAGPLARPALG